MPSIKLQSLGLSSAGVTFQLRPPDKSGANLDLSGLYLSRSARAGKVGGFFGSGRRSRLVHLKRRHFAALLLSSRYASDFKLFSEATLQ